MPKRIRLTVAMLDAMDTALAELLAGEGPQGIDDEDEADTVMDEAAKAQQWVWDELSQRKNKAKV